MKMLDKMMDELHEEVEGARCYAEKYIENKARGNTPRANKFKEMASDELKHAGYLREMAVTDAEGIKRVYNLTENEVEAWEHAHKKNQRRDGNGTAFALYVKPKISTLF